MSKIHLRFDMLQARFPELYQEAERKIDGGVKSSDILADWLNELACYRRGNVTPSPTEKPVDDLDFAKDVMASLE